MRAIGWTTLILACGMILLFGCNGQNPQDECDQQHRSTLRDTVARQSRCSEGRAVRHVLGSPGLGLGSG